MQYHIKGIAAETNYLAQHDIPLVKLSGTDGDYLFDFEGITGVQATDEALRSISYALTATINDEASEETLAGARAVCASYQRVTPLILRDASVFDAQAASSTSAEAGSHSLPTGTESTSLSSTQTSVTDEEQEKDDGQQADQSEPVSEPDAEAVSAGSGTSTRSKRG